MARGAAGIEWCVAEARRGVALGIRSFLVADLGVLATLGALRAAGRAPATLVLKTSVLLPCANPETARELERLGATTINVSTDLSPAELGELRAACAAPLDVYVEVPDDQGGFVRFYEVPEMIRLAAPRLRQARAAQRAEHLPGRAPPRGSRREARPRARPAGRARAAPARASGRPSSSRAAATSARPTSPSRSREERFAAEGYSPPDAGCGFQVGDESLVALSVSFSTPVPPSSIVKIAPSSW